MQKEVEMIESLLKRDCPIVAAWRAKGQPIKCRYFGVGDNCDSCSYSWPELAQEIIDELASGKQSVESYRKRAHTARAKAKAMDKGLAHAIRSAFALGGMLLDEYQAAGGTEEITDDYTQQKVAEADGADLPLHEGADDSGDSGGPGDENRGPG